MSTASSSSATGSGYNTSATSTGASTPTSSVPTHLTPAQLRRLNDYLEAKCLELTRGVRKRLEPDSPYSTLSAYVAAASSLVTMTLLIPPDETSASIRTSWLLRITGEIFEDIPAYSLATQPNPTPDPAEPNEEDELPPQPELSSEGLATLEEVFQLLEKLDAGWCAIIRNERWDSTHNQGVFTGPPPPDDQPKPDSSKWFSTTDRIRLRSLIVSGKNEFDDWLAEQGGASNFEVSERSIKVMSHTLQEVGQDIPIPVQPESEESEDDYS